MRLYNDYLYRTGQMQRFADERTEWEALITGVNAEGQLLVQLADGSITGYTHGIVNWQW